ncbi:MAG: amidohydrolase family protein [Burkholderiales bacterium]|nr:amidohydrolase family protein [Burkholderiales bacterium]
MNRLIPTALLCLTCAAFAGEGDAYIAFKPPVLALTHVEVLDGTGAPAQKDMTVVVRNGRIEALGPFAKVKVPKDAEVKDLHGKSLSPGYVMLHEHTFYPIAYYAYGAMFKSFPHLYLAGGATTIRTAGSMSPYADLNIKRDIESGANIGPDIDVSAPFLNGLTPFVMQMQRITSPGQARQMVSYWAGEGATSYKAYMHLTKAELGAIVTEAHAHGQKVTGHLCSITYREAVDLGIDDLEHGFFTATDFVKDKKPDQCPDGKALDDSLDALPVDSSEMRDLQAYLIDKKVALTSTLTVFETFAAGRPIAPQGALDLLMPQLKEMYLSRWASIAAKKSNVFTTLLPKEMAWEKQFFDAGGLLLAGTDPTGYGGVVPGFSNVRQIELLEEAGLTRPQAMRVSTLNGAIYLGRDKDIGSVEVGKRADFVVYDGSLSEDKDALKRIVWTIKAGVGYDSAKLRAAYLGKVGLQ